MKPVSTLVWQQWELSTQLNQTRLKRRRISASVSERVSGSSPLLSIEHHCILAINILTYQPQAESWLYCQGRFLPSYFFSFSCQSSKWKITFQRQKISGLEVNNQTRLWNLALTVGILLSVSLLSTILMWIRVCLFPTQKRNKWKIARTILLKF